VLAVALIVAVAGAVMPPVPDVDSLSWLPGNTQKILGAPGDQEPFLKWLRTTPRYFPDALDTKLPDCWSLVTKPIVASYQVWGGKEDKDSALLVQGPVDRTLLESCLGETLRILRSTSRLSHAGAITEVESDRFGRAYLGWTPFWVVWNSNRARVEELIAASGGKRSMPPLLAAAVARVDRSGQMWFASTEDFSVMFSGVPSQSVIGAVGPGSGTLMRMTFEYESPANARRAARAVKAASNDIALDDEIRSLARDARPLLRGRFMDLQVDSGIINDPTMMKALQDWVERKKAALRRR